MIFELKTLFPLELEEPGIFTWNVGADLIFGDSSVALLFGFPPDVAISGQKMSAYLGRVHPDDLATVALALHDAITSCGSYHVDYRVRGDVNVYRQVESWGRCFRSADRELTQFAGIIYPVGCIRRVQ